MSLVSPYLYFWSNMDDYTGKKVLVSSDAHIGHRNIIKYCGRPTNSDKIIIEAYRNLFFHDVFLCLGDFGFYGDNGKIQEAFDAIPCTEKILIVGNHDDRNKIVLRLPWTKKIVKKQQPYWFTYNGLIFTAQHRPYREYPRKTHAGRWLLQKITDLFLDIKERKNLGSFLNYQSIPKGAQISLHGHTHEIGQRYDWVDGALLVNCCVEQWDYRPTSLQELEQEYHMRKAYMERK